jgi:hypothetical protein
MQNCSQHSSVTNYMHNSLPHSFLRGNSVYTWNYRGSSVWITKLIFCIRQTEQKIREYNDTVLKLFINFKTAHYSVLRKKTSNNAPTEFCLLMKLVTLKCVCTKPTVKSVYVNIYVYQRHFLFTVIWNKEMLHHQCFSNLVLIITLGSSSKIKGKGARTAMNPSTSGLCWWRHVSPCFILRIRSSDLFPFRINQKLWILQTVDGTSWMGISPLQGWSLHGTKKSQKGRRHTLHLCLEWDPNPRS